MKANPFLGFAAAVTVTAILALAVVVAVPPWCARIPCIVQTRIGEWTGIYFHQLPRNFTGRLHLWDERGRLAFEHPYKNGLRDGKWFRYETDGQKVTQGEYREGKPWDGLCFIYDEKGWIGEYRQGRPWNGCLPVVHGDETVWNYFIDGQGIPEAEFKERKHIPEGSSCVGLHHGSTDGVKAGEPMRTRSSTE